MSVSNRFKNSSAVVFAICAVAIVYGGFACTSSSDTNTNNAEMAVEDMREDNQSGDVINVTSSGSYSATITTDKGVIEVDLYNDIAHIYVKNFVDLAQSGFYDGAQWHRVIPGFVIQTGINADGQQAAEFDDVFHPDMKHNDAGILSMANRGLNTNTSQFFITHGPTPHLDPYENGEPKPCGTLGVSCHAVFGKVTSGIEAVFNTQQGDVIESITIRARAQ